MPFFFRELSCRYIRLYGMDGSERPWRWRNVHMGPFESFFVLYKLVSQWTQCRIFRASKSKGLLRHFEGRYLEWPILLLFKRAISEKYFALWYTNYSRDHFSWPVTWFQWSRTTISMCSQNIIKGGWGLGVLEEELLWKTEVDTVYLHLP